MRAGGAHHPNGWEHRQEPDAEWQYGSDRLSAAVDGEDAVVKALSWALRKLSERDPDAVRSFVARHDERLAARVRREVRNKLATGLKNPAKGRTRSAEPHSGP